MIDKYIEFMPKLLEAGAYTLVFSILVLLSLFALFLSVCGVIEVIKGEH